jgi:hypothetical protein
MKSKSNSNGTAVKNPARKILAPETVFPYLDSLQSRGFGYWSYAERISNAYGCTLKEGHDIMEEWRYSNTDHTSDLSQFIRN